MRLQFACDAALTDIEGTLGSIAFVRETLFPYARQHLGTFVRAHRGQPAVESALSDAAQASGISPRDEASLVETLRQWIDEDRKTTSLKTLQGAIWARGYEDGALRGHLYDDAVDALQVWRSGGIALYVYSSGSVEAQRLFFTHSVAGNLLHLFDGCFDTTLGPKTESSSYSAIARGIGVPAKHILFLSDSIAELNAARDAGMRTVQIVRSQDGTKPAPGHAFVQSFDALELRSMRALLDR
ncbi:MAG: acireductone synthase [Candidatus Eremiobacteraeota bacterium]|nr:acireductone synthase [Candidatus Eremiobacteraeota bacterium]